MSIMNSGIMSSKIGNMAKGAIGGFSMGGPVGGIVGAVQGANPNSPLSKAMGLYQTGNSLGMNSLSGGSNTPQTDANFNQPEMGAQFKGQSPSLGGDAMGRALQSQQQTPAFQVKNGMDLVMNHPVSELGISPELHAQLFETFARAHHFGYGGGLDESGNEQMDNGGYA